MPQISDWEPPKVAFLVEGFPFHYCYRNDECSISEAHILSEWYQVLPEGSDNWDAEAWIEFDIRELPEYVDAEQKVSHDDDLLFDCESDVRKLHKSVLFDALRSGSLRKHLQEKLKTNAQIIKFPLEMDDWKVDITRISSRTHTVNVRARSETEAEDIALANAGDHDFTQHSESAPEYKAGAYRVSAG